MKVLFPNDKKTYENTEEAIVSVVNDINEFISSTENMVLSHLNIDGNNVYQNHYQYLLNSLPEIHEIKVVLKSQEEVVIELQNSLNEYLERALPVIEEVSNQFYQGESKEAWDYFVDLTSGLEWIHSAVVALSNYSNEETKQYYLSVSQKLKETIQELANALEAKDTVTIADIIQYEILEALNELKETVHH